MSTMTDKTCLKMICFNPTSRQETRSLLFWPQNKESNALNGYYATTRLSACAVLSKLTTPARWLDRETLLAEFVLQL